MTIGELSGAQRELAMARWALLCLHLDEGVPLAEAARQAGVALRTARRWLACYRAEGLAGLVRQPRSDKGQRALPGQLVTVIEGLALRRPPLSAATIHRKVVELAGEHDWPAPSYSTVYAIIAGLDPGVDILAGFADRVVCIPLLRVASALACVVRYSLCTWLVTRGEDERWITSFVVIGHVRRQPDDVGAFCHADCARLSSGKPTRTGGA